MPILYRTDVGRDWSIIQSCVTLCARAAPPARKIPEKTSAIKCFSLSIRKSFEFVAFESCILPIVFKKFSFFLQVLNPLLSYILKLHSFLRRFLSIIHEFCFFSSLRAGDIISPQSKERMNRKVPPLSTPKERPHQAVLLPLFC